MMDSQSAPVPAVDPAASAHLPVIVVGAGIAGLVTAYHLKKKKIPVIVLEAEEYAGGRARSFVHEVAGRRIVVHRGAQMSSPAYEVVRAIIEELGLFAQVVPNSRRWSILIDGALLQFEDGNQWSTKGTVLSNEEWWDFGQESLLRWNSMLRGRSVVDPAHWLDHDDEYAGTWLARNLDPGPARLLSALAHAFYFQRPDAVTKALPLSLWARLIDQTFPESLLDGFGMLVDALVANIGDVRLRHRVRHVQVQADRVLVEVEGQPQPLSASDVVIATDATVARAIYPGATAAERALLDVAYVPTFNIVLDVDMDWHGHDALSGTYGVWVPPDQMRPDDIIASITLESGRTRRPTPGHETVQIMLDAGAAQRLIGTGHREILERAVREASARGLLPGLDSAHRNYGTVFEIGAAIPETRPGRFRTIVHYERTIDRQSRVKFAGDYRGFPRVGSAAMSGAAAAAETEHAILARRGQWSQPLIPARPARRPSTPVDDLQDAARGYVSAVMRWGEAIVRADARGAEAAWINGWRAVFQGMGATARMIYPPLHPPFVGLRRATDARRFSRNKSR